MGGSPHRLSVIGDVEVDRTESGGLRVSWTVAGDCPEVDLAWGRSADGLDHAHVLSAPASDGEAFIQPGLLPQIGRVYVSVAPAGSPAGPGATISAERRVGLRGPVNFRDVGGYRTLDGRTVRWGRVFRSDALLLHDDDLDDFAGLGIRTVYDLRSATERTAVPNRLPDGHSPKVVILPLVREDPDDNPLDGLDVSDGENFLEQLYRHILERSAANFGQVLTGLAEQENLPAVFHCAAGKDRTGMVAAVLLAVLGVPLEVILDDYELTGRYRTTDHVAATAARLGEARDMAPEVVAGMLRAPRWAMQSALTDLAARHGGFDGYLVGPAGAAPDVPGRLRSQLLGA